jgi:TonB family protein
MTLGYRRRLPLALTLPAIAGFLLTLAAPASAQSEGNKADASLERAQKQADAVFHWIKLNADKGATRPNTPAPAPAPAPAPTAAAAPKRPAPTPPPAAAPALATAKPATAPTPTATAAATPTTPTTAQSAPPPAVAPQPVVVAAEREPEAAPVLLASAAPTPAPATPMAAAARLSAEPAKPAQEAPEAPLKLMFKVEPDIPRQMRQNFRGGFAQVQFTVQPDGSVSQAQSVKASNTRLGAVAVDAVKQWRFAPIAKAREAAVEVSFNNGEEN